MQVSWSESLSTGSAAIDQQHRQLFAQVESLEKAMKQGKGRQQIVSILSFLERYVIQHFKEEESVMELQVCPAAAANKAAHRDFLARFGGLKERLENSGTSPSLAIEAYDFLCQWLVTHIKSIDTQLRNGATGERSCLAGAAIQSN